MVRILAIYDMRAVCINYIDSKGLRIKANGWIRLREGSTPPASTNVYRVKMSFGLTMTNNDQKQLSFVSLRQGLMTLPALIQDGISLDEEVCFPSPNSPSL